jgi:hypothetical protein
MTRLRERLTYANVMATIAVFIALGGVSYAAIKLPKNSVGAKQLKNNAVTTAKIMDQAVSAAKIQNGSLTGAQINASTLGTVPNAAHAASADTAANADTLDGLNASDFAPEAKVQTPDRIVLNDPSPGDYEEVETSLIAGGFKLRAACYENFGGEGKDFAAVVIVGPHFSSYVGWRNGTYVGYSYLEAEDLILNSVYSPGTELAGWNFTVAAPNGEVINTSGSVEVHNPAAGDCVYGITVIGP